MIRRNTGKHYCYRDKRELNREDYEEGWEDDGTGGKVRVTRYKDGTSTVHHGGPCGPAHFDEFGEEC